MELPSKRALAPVVALAAGTVLVLWRIRQLRHHSGGPTSADGPTMATEAASETSASLKPSAPEPEPVAQPDVPEPAAAVNARPPVVEPVQPRGSDERLAPSERLAKEQRRDELIQQLKDVEQLGRKQPSAPPAAPPPESTASATPAVSAAELAARVGPLLDDLRPTFAGGDDRKRIVLELLDALRQGMPGGAAGATAKEQRAIARAFVDGDGPQIVYEMESSMNGNWIADAKNGTMQRLSEISRLPGPVGKAMATHRALAEKNKIDAADLNCTHGPRPLQ